MNREQKRRKNLICYFLAAAKAQEEVQNLQERLILSAKFNPLALYKKISKNDPPLTLKKFKSYLAEKGIKSVDGVQSYSQRHDLQGKISCQLFINSFLPYTPDVLRNVKTNISEQVQQLKVINEKHEYAYIEIIERQIYHLLRLSSMKRSIFSKGNYKDVKKFILNDLQNYGSLKDKNEFQTVDLMIIRKWLEIWIYVDEYEILNLMRWFKGEDEDSINRTFCCANIQEVDCWCKEGQKNIEKMRSPKKKSKQNNEQILQIWCFYVFSIMKSERQMDEQRKNLFFHRNEVKQIIKGEIISKKKTSTSIRKVFSFIEKYTSVSKIQVKKWEENLGYLSLQNFVLFAIFYCDFDSKDRKDQSFMLQIRQSIAQVLRTYCEAKYELVKLSKEILQKNIGGTLFSLLTPQNQKYLTIDDMKNILDEMEIDYVEKEVEILMKHFGDGKLITQFSFKNVFKLQGS